MPKNKTLNKTVIDEQLRESGLRLLGSVPWGTHFCQFYRTDKDLLDILVPYFKAGLKNNEYCMWVTSEPLTRDRVEKEMRKRVVNFESYLKKGQIEIIPYDRGYLKGGSFDDERVLSGWAKKLKRALQNGYQGLRLTGNTFWLERNGWRAFTDYEEQVNSVIGNYRMITLCTYSLDKCGANEIIDVINNHQYAIIKRTGGWELIESSERRKTQEALSKNQEDFKRAQSVGNMGNWRLNVQNNELLWSDENYRIFGVPKGTTLTYETFLSIVHPDDRNYVDKKWKAGMQGENYDIEHRIVADGKVKWVREKAFLEFDKRGALLAGFGITQDITVRRYNEETLRETRDYLNTLLNYANAPIITWDPKYRITRFNHAFERLTQRKNKEVLGEKLNILFPSKTKRKSLEHIRQASAGKHWESVEIPILRSDGVTRIVLWNSATIYTLDGKKPIATIAQGQDITERKKAEDNLKKAHDELDKKVQERTVELRKTNKFLEREIETRVKTEINLAEAKKNLDTIFESTKEGLALYDKDGRTVQINPALSKLFRVKQNIIGVNREEIAKNREKYFGYYMERYDDSIKTQKTVYSGKPVSNVMIKVHSTPSRYLEANYVPVKGVKGKVIGMIGSFRDVTVMKNQEVKITKQLLEAEKQKNRWQAIFENVEEGILILGKDLRILQANNTCELMSGYAKKEMLGKPFYEIFNCHNQLGKKYPEFSPISKALISGEAVPYDEHLHSCKDGRERWVGVSYTPIFNEKGEIEQIVSVIRDITAIKDIARAKTDFVSLASHELRTPLTVINGYLSLLLGGDIDNLIPGKPVEGYKIVSDKIYNETKRLTKLVEELLNISRIEEGRLRLSLRSLSVKNILDEVTGEFKEIAKEKNIELKFRNNIQNNSENLVVTADKDKFKQILVNLIDNALKFTNSGGKISIDYIVKNSEAHIHINDDGEGISDFMLPRIFEKFQQGSNPYVKENKGAGLGLFIVKSLVELHHGRIWVDSTVGKGTKFTFTLPVVATR